MNPVDPMSRHISQRRAIVGRGQNFGLEPPHLACRCGLGINGPSSDHLSHRRIRRQTICVIQIIISRQPTEDRLAQEANERMQSIAASSGVSQNSTRNVVQAQHLIRFPKQGKSTVRPDLGPMKFQPEPAVKTMA